MNEGYPESWRHIVWAETVERLMQFGAKVVVFDVIFSRKASDVQRVERLLKQMKNEGAQGGLQEEERVLALAAADTGRFRAAVDKYASRLVFGMSYEVDGRMVRLLLPHPTIAPEDFENLLGNVLYPVDSDETAVGGGLKANDMNVRTAIHRWVDDELVLDI